MKISDAVTTATLAIYDDLPRVVYHKDGGTEGRIIIAHHVQKVVDTETATLRTKIGRMQKALKWIKGRFPFSRWSTADGTGHWHCRCCGTDMEIDDPKHEPDCPVGILIEAAQEKTE